MRTNEIPVPTEEVEQECLMRWINFSKGRFPDLELAIHIPNEGKRSAWYGALLKRLGLRSGVPDLLFPVPRGDYGCLFIELKRQKDGRVSPMQKWWIDKLNKAGNYAVVCEGWEKASKVIEWYFSLDKREC